MTEYVPHDLPRMCHARFMVGRTRGAYAQTNRVLALLDRLSVRRFPVPLVSLADELNISERQLRRDLRALDAAGHRVEVTVIDGRTAVKLADGLRAGVLQLSLRERWALLAVRGVFDVLEGTPLYEDVTSIYEKVSASLPKDQRDSLRALGDRFVYLSGDGIKSYTGKEDVLDAILTGVLRRNRVRFRYKSKSGEVTRGVLEPYAMVLYKQGLYTIGRVRTAAGVVERTFAVERFTSAEHQRGATFQVPKDFHVQRFFQGAFGIHHGESTHRVVVDFDASARPLVEARRWHPSQRLIKLPNGGVRAELDVSDLTEVVHWIVGWGPKAKARAPKPLVDRVAE